MYKKRYDVDVHRGFSKIFSSTKRGQLTVFIILGIILLLIITLLLLTKQEIVKIKPEELIPTEKGKVESFITQCIKTVGEEALFQLGLQGGYITVPSEMADDASQHLRISPFLVVPYWALGPQTRIPSLEGIKQRLDLYVEENVPSCLFSMEAFQDTYNLIEKSSIAADTEILDNKVIFSVDWDVEVQDKNGDTISELINHRAESPIQLGKIYATAKTIVEREMLTLKLEDITQDLIALEHPNVPLVGMDISCNRKIWGVNSVKETIKDLLRVNIKQLRVQGTEFVEFPAELPYYQNHYVWDMGEGFVQPDIGVVFNFEKNYPFTFQVTPLSGSKLTSQQQGGKDLLSFLCVQTWKFTYDLMYPVLVRVQDETTGYTFNLAFTVHLVRNIPNREALITARPYNNRNFPTDEEYCRNQQVPMTVLTNSVVDSPEAGVYYPQPLEGVNISFTCLKYRCEMGQTEFNYEQSGFQSGITLNYPYCVGGILRGIKAGYKEDWQRIVTESEKVIELNLIPLHKLPVRALTVVKYDKANPQKSPEPLAQNEMALIRLKHYKNGTVDHQFEQVIGSRISRQAAENLHVEFLADADFQYELEIHLFNDETLIGGYKGNWTPAWNQLQDAQEIIFPTIHVDNPQDEELYNLLLTLSEQSKVIPNPEIKT